MSRLVDVNKLKEAIIKEYLRGKKTLMEVIDEQPTTFDVDEVVRQIKDIKDKEYVACTDQECGYCKYFSTCSCGDKADKLALDKAIEIVEDGGVDGN